MPEPVVVHVHNHFHVDAGAFGAAIAAPIAEAIDRLRSSMAEQYDRLVAALGRIDASTNDLAGRVGTLNTTAETIVRMEGEQVAELRRLADIIAAGGVVTEQQMRDAADNAERIAGQAETVTQGLGTIETALQGIAAPGTPENPGEEPGGGTGEEPGGGTGEEPIGGGGTENRLRQGRR